MNSVEYLPRYCSLDILDWLGSSSRTSCNLNDFTILFIDDW